MWKLPSLSILYLICMLFMSCVCILFISFSDISTPWYFFMKSKFVTPLKAGLAFWNCSISYYFATSFYSYYVMTEPAELELSYSCFPVSLAFFASD